MSASCRSLLAPAFAVAVACSIVPLAAPVCAQDRASSEAAEEERAGRARGGGYAWGDSSTDDVPSASSYGPSSHHYARLFGTVGAGMTIRVLEYQSLNQSRFAPVYLQLRGGYYFEGEGDVQHGIGLGISTNLMPDGGPDVLRDPPLSNIIGGLDPLAAWTFTPQYMIRAFFTEWFHLVGRVGVSVTAAALPNWGFEVGIQPLFMLLAGFGLYIDVSYSMFFSGEVEAEIHPLISIEGGLSFDLEFLP